MEGGECAVRGWVKVSVCIQYQLEPSIYNLIIAI